MSDEAGDEIITVAVMISPSGYVYWIPSEDAEEGIPAARAFDLDHYSDLICDGTCGAVAIIRMMSSTLERMPGTFSNNSRDEVMH